MVQPTQGTSPLLLINNSYNTKQIYLTQLSKNNTFLRADDDLIVG